MTYAEYKLAREWRNKEMGYADNCNTANTYADCEYCGSRYSVEKGRCDSCGAPITRVVYSEAALDSMLPL
jgi:ribosomal protein L37E